MPTLCRAVYTLPQLEGAWWSDPDSPTADFAIDGAEIWLEPGRWHRPARLVGGDTLVYDLGPDRGTIRRRIVSLEHDTIVLESSYRGETVTTIYSRER